MLLADNCCWLAVGRRPFCCWLAAAVGWQLAAGRFVVVRWQLLLAGSWLLCSACNVFGMEAVAGDNLLRAVEPGGLPDLVYGRKQRLCFVWGYSRSIFGKPVAMCRENDYMYIVRWISSINIGCRVSAAARDNVDLSTGFAACQKNVACSWFLGLHF